MAIAFPILAEMGIIFGEALEGVGLGTGASNFVATTAVGLATTKINTAIQTGLYDAGVGIIGQDNVDVLTANKQTAIGLSGILFSNDPELSAREFASKQEPSTRVTSHPITPPVEKPKPKTLHDVFNFSDKPKVVVNNKSIVTSDANDFRPEEISKYIVAQATNLATSHDPVKGLSSDAISKSISDSITDPKTLSLAQKLSGYLADKSAPITEEYKAVAAVYNGKSITDKSVIMSYDSVAQWLVFQAYDETGELITLNENKGLVLPAVPGFVFVGPNSPNNAYPVDLLDTFAFFHDAGYAKGFFDRKSDLQFISRLSQNRDRFDSSELAFVNATIVYFSTISLTLGTLTGSLPVEVSKGVINNATKDDIFPILVPSSDTLNIDDYKIARYNFYKGLNETMTKEHSISGYHAIASKPNAYLGNLFNQLEIQIN